MYPFNKYIFRIVFLIAISSYSQNNSNKKKVPNIVFIFSDDHATNAITAYGGVFKELAPTPNIERIANEGALLKNALCTNATAQDYHWTINGDGIDFFQEAIWIDTASGLTKNIKTKSIH